MIRPTGQSLVAKGILEGALGLSTAGVLTSPELVATGCTVVPRTLMTKGVIPCPDASAGLALATRGALCCPIVIIEEPEEPGAPGRPSVGGGGVSKPTREKLKRVKVTVLMSGDTFVQEVVVDPSVSVEAQIKETIPGIQNAIFVKAKRSR